MRRHVRHRRSSPRRKFQWGDSWWTSELTSVGPGLGFVDAQWIRPPAGTLLDESGLAGNASVETDWTLVRSLHYLDFTLNNAPGNPIDCYFAFGVIAWDATNSGDPPTDTIPWPITYLSQNTASDDDWIWKSIYPIKDRNESATVFGTAFPVQTTDGSSLRTESRAQRKLSSGTGLMLVVQLFQPGASTVVSSVGWSYYGRFGFKLP